MPGPAIRVGSNSYQFTSYSVSVSLVSYTASCSLLALTRSVICCNRRMRYKYRLIKVLILYYSSSLARFGNVGARPGEDAVTGGARLGVRASRPGLRGGMAGNIGARPGEGAATGGAGLGARASWSGLCGGKAGLLPPPWGPYRRSMKSGSRGAVDVGCCVRSVVVEGVTQLVRSMLSVSVGPVGQSWACGAGGKETGVGAGGEDVGMVGRILLSIYIIVRLVPLWDVEEDVLKPVVRGVLVFVRVVLLLPEDLEEASQQHPAWVSFF